MKSYNMTLTEKRAKISALSSGKIDKYEYLTGEEILLSDQIRVIEAKFTYSPFGKALEKQTNTIENQDKKQIKEIEDHGNQLVESNELIKKDFNIDRDSIPLEEQKKIFNKLVEENSSEFRNLEKIINPDNLIYKC